MSGSTGLSRATHRGGRSLRGLAVLGVMVS
jgi:hypothetical protein